MTTRTRRLLILATFVVALTIPTEMVLLQAITQNSREAAAAWVANLSPEDVEAYSGQLGQLPIQYRKEILRQLGPERGAAIWRNHIESYRDAHPELSAEQVEALGAVLGLLTPETIVFPTSDERAAVQVLAARVGELFGTDVQRLLLHDLGPRFVGFSAQATPIRQRLEDFVREHFVVNADGARCECIAAWECDATSEGNVNCEDTSVSGCSVVTSWPACGFAWMEDCTGRCKTIYVE